MNKSKRTYLILVFWLIFHSTAFAQGLINIDKIIQIESSGNPNAIGKAGEIGLCQISSGVLKEYNEYNRIKYSKRDLFDPEINKKIAIWYFDIRIPQMLRHYKVEINIKNSIIAYNAGINYVNKRIPRKTIDYIRKYNKD